jgi:hypothetical protein
MFKYLADVAFSDYEDYDWEKHLKFLKKNPEIKYVFGIDEKFGPYIEIIGAKEKVLECAVDVLGDYDAENYIEEVV